MGKQTPIVDWVQRAPQSSQMERFEAFFSGHGFTLHRHDTYAIGRTLSGVQSFKYRGSQRHSLPGGTMVLHPDEVHDGEAGTRDGFKYRMIYLQPSLIQSALGGRPLPFVPGGLSADPRLRVATEALLQSMDNALDPLEEQDAIFDLAQALNAVCGAPSKRRSFDYLAAERAREFIHGSLDRTVTLDELAEHSGRDRWNLCRDFRLLFGTSPYRYLSMRRLDLVRSLLVQGHSLTEAALMAGFTDQSHMTRQFRTTFGLAPGHWQKMQRLAGNGRR
ncbi:AraC family transcriptional regulator [Pseudomonas gingeri]|uniref:AraC family transcriptional regulator n=1 Tax=Pseudomonas gingeri TaxID=117681 RepID=A0A7Y7YC08_9PSED|nr:AraC family transcriptional regulator [Pseudomonas gingeri]NWB30019.1 AraC family transcriptional regulator [Pseudomonas gingeri]NWC33608.1 AraC family transcriptional regulator [Pseudomonas gingeri]NWD05653.1 AraC family transcriptional regulator [Pseudomonas gingeri]NWD51924.1 AraC family transcriptional regulator [Pseudomonas gingeri]NWE32131.1 AraC family transcriptional regulator [Pseudomonas gingeri]